MYFVDTTDMPALPPAVQKKAVHLPGVHARDIEKFGLKEYLDSCRIICEYLRGHGNGNVVTEFINGTIQKVGTTFNKYFTSSDTKMN